MDPVMLPALFVGFVMSVWALVIFSQIRQELAGMRAILSTLSGASTATQANARDTKGAS
jgi:hypothetical protein